MPSTNSPAASSSNATTLQDLIPVMNRLQDVLMSTLGSAASSASGVQDVLDLPQLVVVGAQSSGKSSVLENLVQRDFLPRGNDIVTRRPLILQLIHLSSENQPAPVEYAEFLHLPNERFMDFTKVRAEIERETERVAGGNKGISKEPISLRIYSPNVLNLTLVDLPGLTKIPIGDQPPDIEYRTRKLIMDYIAKPNAIILAVTPANQDIVNSDALKLAREVDPDGKRTLGVLTKVDLMDAGTNAYDLLAGRAPPFLQLGFIGVVNRSQQDIQQNRTVQESLKKEKQFFAGHSAYARISSRCGTSHLAKTLNAVLMHHIRERLPELKSKLNLLIIQTEQELASYGDPVLPSPSHHSSLVLRLLTQFSNNFCASVDGTFFPTHALATGELSGGARLYYIFHQIFGQTLMAMDPCAGWSVQEVRTAIRNATGPRPALFIPEVAFDILIKPQIKKLEVPSLRCVELAFDELLKMVNSCETKELMRFPRLHQRIVQCSIDLIRERMSPTQAYIESLISIQMAYINTNHPDFIGGGTAMAMLEKKHEMRRRKEIEKMQRRARKESNPPSQGNSTANIIVNPAPSTAAAAPTKSIASEHESRHSTSKDKKYYDYPPVQLPHGRDSGFLTYFFGGNPNISPEPSGANAAVGGMVSRSESPIRPEMMDQLSIRSDDHQPTTGLGSITTFSTQSSPERDDIEVELLRSLINSYFEITRKTITDLVPKTIMHLIVNYVRENIQNRLVSSLYKEEIFAELLREDDTVLRERAHCKQMLETYRRGAQILQDIF